MMSRTLQLTPNYLLPPTCNCVHFFQPLSTHGTTPRSSLALHLHLTSPPSHHHHHQPHHPPYCHPHATCPLLSTPQHPTLLVNIYPASPVYLQLFLASP